MKRVVITGIGLSTSLGHSLSTIWSSLHTSPALLPSSIPPFRVGGIDISQDLLLSLPYGKNKQNALALQSAESAVLDSSLDLSSEESKIKTAVTVSSVKAQLSPGIFFSSQIAKESYRTVTPELYKHLTLNAPSVNIAKALDIQGPCISAGPGFSSIKHGILAIEDGCDIAIVGNTEQLVHDWYFKSGISKNRDPADGAGVLILEEMSHALNRKAKIYAEIKKCEQGMGEINTEKLENIELVTGDQEEIGKIALNMGKYFGYMMGGLGCIQVGIALLIMKHKKIPPMLRQNTLTQLDFSRVLCISRSFEGSTGCLLLSSLNS